MHSRSSKYETPTGEISLSAALFVLFVLLFAAIFTSVPVSAICSRETEGPNMTCISDSPPPWKEGSSQGDSGRGDADEREGYNSFMDYSDVVLIVNDDSQMSKDIADYFVANRVFPPGNIINITAPSGETVNRDQFDEFRLQIEDNITSRNLTTKINYILTTKGVPLRISGSGDYKASVDSELALILGPNQNSIGNLRWLVNPYYNAEGRFDSQKYGMYLVNRLTAYTLDEVKAIIDRASMSLNVTGKFVLDVDPGRDGSPGYKVGNDWLRGANTILSNRGYEVIHDETNTFLNNISGVAGYSSWGSNDGHWFKDLVSNSGMETDSNSDGIPNDWYASRGGSGSVIRTDEDPYRNTYSVNITRSTPGDDETALYHNITIEPGTRYYLSGYANLSGVSGEGKAHIRIRAHNAQDAAVWMKNGTLRSGTTADWSSMGQIVYEPIEGIRKLSVGCVLSRSSGTVFFDYVRLNEIRPRMEFLPGAIAETFVSTGGRSFNYPTSYGQSLVADILREGVTGIKGYTWEPYLSAISHPNILFDRYTTGHNLAESFWAGSNLVSWMGTVVGDPKCCPYLFERAELKIADLSLSKVAPHQSDDIRINFTVKNTGETGTPSFKIYLRNGTDDGEILHSADMTITPGSAINVSFHIDLLHRGGTNRFIVQVDPTEKVMEVFENDNDEFIDLYVNSYPYVNKTLPPIDLYEDSMNVTIDLSDGYFTDPEADLIHYKAVLHGPTQDQADNVGIEVEGTFLYVSSTNNYTDDNVPIRIYCSDILPVGTEVHQDTFIRILGRNDPPFLVNGPEPIVLEEDTMAISKQLTEEEIFDDIDSEELFYCLELDPFQNYSEELSDDVNVSLNEFDYILVNAGGDFFGNITLRVHCSDSEINRTEGLPFADIIIVISPVNDPPRFNGTRINVSAPEDSMDLSVLDLRTVCHDVDNEFRELAWYVLDVSPTGIGAFDVMDGFLIISLEENYTSEVVLKLKVSDGKYSNTDHIYIDIVPSNDPPVVIPKSVDVLDNGNITVEFVFFDSDSPAANMTLEVSLNGSLLFSIEELVFKALGDNTFVFKFSFHPDVFNISSGNHTLKLILTDIENASGMAEVVIRVPDGDDVAPDDDDVEDDDLNGTDDDEGNDHEGDGGEWHGRTNTICILVLFGAASLGVVGVFIYLKRKKMAERGRVKEEREEKWRMLYGNGSNAPSIPSRGEDTVDTGGYEVPVKEKKRPKEYPEDEISKGSVKHQKGSKRE